MLMQYDVRDVQILTLSPHIYDTAFAVELPDALIERYHEAWAQFQAIMFEIEKKAEQTI